MDGKIAIITRTSLGVGRAIAFGFGHEGARMVRSDIRVDARPEGYEDDGQMVTAEMITAKGGQACFVHADVTHGKTVKSLVQQLVERFRRIEIMVFNSEVFTRQRRSMRRLKKSTILSRRGMLKVYGTDANRLFVSSSNKVMMARSLILSPSPGYCASKAASANLTRQLAADYGQHRISVNAICLNLFTTAMTRPFHGGQDIKFTGEGITPLQHWGTDQDLVGPAIFMASAESGYVTGNLMMADGGFTAK